KMAGTAGVCHLLGLNADSGAMGTLRCAGMPPRSRDRARPAVGTHAGRASRGGTSGGVVPFRWTPGQIEVEVSVNGTALEWFIVDSGAEYSILDDQLAHASTSARPHGSDGRSRHGVSLRGPNQWKHHDNRSPHSAVGWIGPALSRSVLRDGEAVWVRYRWPRRLPLSENRWILKAPGRPQLANTY